ncbi:MULTISPECIES: hypothetical protein [Ignavibacterium]|jgi:ligand-binding sensor domain-containing protein|uniref:hypothetical protein n=1 Tax=Ignavibacterium TaxID=795750 RepID=UPI0025BE1582|nr:MULTISPECIES: hypothetical protein [Ignavibacterium]MBI5662448.1 hypothetical protein [Ignavibacterium album]
MLILKNKFCNRSFPGINTPFIILFIITTLFSRQISAQIESRLFLEKAFVTDIKQFGSEIWVATYGQGIYQFNLKDNKWTNYSSKTSDVNNDLFHCVAVNKDFIWAGGNEGLFIYNRKTKKWTLKKFSDGGEFGNWIRALYIDYKNNKLWIGRFRNITLYDLKTNTYKEYNKEVGGNAKTNNINCISAEADSAIWFGAESGVHKLNLKVKDENLAWEYFTNKGRWFKGEGVSVSVSDILFQKNSIWFATDEFITKEQPQYNPGGIYIFDRKLNWERIGKANGLGGNGIYTLEKVGNYIFTGVYEFRMNDKTEYGKGLFMINRLNNKVIPVDLSQIDISTSTIRKLHFDGDFLWLGTDNGLVRIKISNPLGKWGTR